MEFQADFKEVNHELGGNLRYSQGSAPSGGVNPARIASIDLYSANWQGDASPYSQVVSINGVTAYSKVDINPSVEQLEIFHEKDIAFVTENENGIVTVFCIGQKPTNDYTMQVTITEVSANA